VDQVRSRKDLLAEINCGPNSRHSSGRPGRVRAGSTADCKPANARRPLFPQPHNQYGRRFADRVSPGGAGRWLGTHLEPCKNDSTVIMRAIRPNSLDK